MALIRWRSRLKVLKQNPLSVNGFIHLSHFRWSMLYFLELISVMRYSRSHTMCMCIYNGEFGVRALGLVWGRAGQRAGVKSTWNFRYSFSGGKTEERNFPRSFRYENHLTPLYVSISDILCPYVLLWGRKKTPKNDFQFLIFYD